MYISKGYIRGIKKEIKKYYRIKKTRKNFMKTLGRALLWVSGVIFIMFGLLLIVGVSESMLWTIGSIPIGFALCYVAYKFMVWSGFEEPIKESEEA